MIKVTCRIINSAVLSPHVLHICHCSECPLVVSLVEADITNFLVIPCKNICFHCNWYFLCVEQMTGRKGRVVQTEDGVQYESRSEVDVPLETLNLTG